MSAAASIDAASKAVDSMLAHQRSEIPVLDADPFKNIDFTVDSPDTAAARLALGGFEPKLAPALAQDRADRRALESARARLNSSLLTLPEQGMLADSRRRVDAALAGLAAADQQLTWRQQEADFLHPFFDVIDGWAALKKAANANDPVGVVAQLQLITTSQQRSAALAKTPAIPPQLIAQLSTLQKTIDDFHALLNADQANDDAAYARYDAALTADAAALSKYDSAAADNYEKTQFDRLTAQYNHDMQVAAGN